MKTKTYISLFTVIILTLCNCRVGFTQSKVNLSVDHLVHNFGNLTAADEAVADFILLNNGKNNIYLLRADFPDDCKVRYSTTDIPVGGQAIVRIKYNPEKRGPFKKDIKVWFGESNTPVNLTVTGDYKTIDLSANLNCPGFDPAGGDRAAEKDLLVNVFDHDTRQPIASARVKWHPRLGLNNTNTTDENGQTRRVVPIGNYIIDADAKGYETGRVQIYIGGGMGIVNIYLKHVAIDFPPAVQDQIDEKNKEVIRQDVTVIRDELPDSVVNNYVSRPGELNANTYKPNNIVFLVDVSSSMVTADRLPLLKISMKTLLTNLRGIDRVTLITYASKVNVALQPISADEDNKKMIGKKIDSLKAYGSTQGGKAIREAYKLAEENFVSGGNNQIILATDGSFNLDKTDEALFEVINQEKEKKIYLTVFGFGKDKTAIAKMKKMAETGGGSFIYITDNDHSSEILVEEVKMRSRK